MAHPVPIRIRASQQNVKSLPDQVRHRTYRLDSNHDMGSRGSSPYDLPSRSKLT